MTPPKHGRPAMGHQRSVWLPDDLAGALDALALKRRTSASQIIRELLVTLLPPEPPAPAAYKPPVHPVNRRRAAVKKAFVKSNDRTGKLGKKSGGKPDGK